ncbi:MAG TPA: nitronate monooxygenase [Smithella sp.]|jgi:enoyl-[acyl-carrier protein] reductase II|nr:nitronate monooxygenase [Smithella sp.]NMC96900.1 nitronate monooxygenase [Deltaproteobacteria bacterium]OQC53105.1 MAG: Nitronate monooxygenase [Deltaproteobacteria bacterium ADurb.Bin022]HOG10898.1 nitronate monooxygenase [Smithella sp.]HOS14963.1 nitronate monooxygenase [Smithella sp.]
MKTKIAELFGIQYPVILPGMSWISVPELVAAVSNAGGIGYLATGPLSPAKTRQSIKRIRELTDKPFGVGATLLMPGAYENALVAIEEKVPVLNISLGKGGELIKKVHAYGGKVISTVTTVEHALAAQKSGADALQVTGFEAAAHGSQVTTLVLVPTVVDAVKIPVVAIGGIADGRGMAAAFALGAEGVGMGTRLSITKESPVHQLAMQKQLELGAEDTIYSNRFDALYCRVLKTPSAEKAVKQGRNLAKGLAASFDIAKSLDLSWMKLATSILGGSKKDKSGKPKEADTAPKQKKGEISLFQKMMKGPQTGMNLAHMAQAYVAIKKATENGDLKDGVYLSGQVQGIIHDIPTVAEVINRTVEEFTRIQKDMAGEAV